jgi:streptogrisin D
MRRRVRLLAAMSTVLLLAFGTWTTPAIGSDQKSTASSQSTPDRRMLAQAPLAAASDRIQQLVDARRLSGFAGTELDGDTLVLYWHGAVPAVLGQALGQIRREVPVQVRPARYSLATLLAEARRLLGAYSEGAVKLTSAGPLDDYSGLEVGVDPSTPASTRRAIRSKVPVVLVDQAQAVPASRWFDSSPFWGGAAIARTGNVACSTAFGARKSNGAEVMISARHCGVNQTWRTAGGGVLYGTSNAGNHAGLDAMLLGGQNYQGYIYVGPYTSNSSRRVTSRGNPGNQTVICHGGAFSGEVCGTTVAGINRFVNVQGVGTVGPGFWTVHGGNVATAGPGDSGGPSYRKTATILRAHGIIIAIDLNFGQRCQGIPDRFCSIRTFSTNIDNIMSVFTLAILTS